MGRESFFRFFCNQWLTVPKLEKQDLSGETVLIVGANTGLGLEAAKHLARMGPGKLVVACRSLKKGDDAAKEIQKATGYDRTVTYVVDLSVFSSVNAFVDAFEKNEERLDILLFNAGVAVPDFRPTKDGFEETIQVNDMSCSLLCIGLLPLMLKTSEATASASHRPRITVVTSQGHLYTQPRPEELAAPNYLLKLNEAEHCKRPEVAEARYPLSKLLNVLFIRELATRIPSSKVVINCVNPGFCHTGLRRNAGFKMVALMTIMDHVLGNTAEQGGRRIAWAAIAHRNCEMYMHGRYTSYSEITEESDWCMSPEGFSVQRRLWNEMADVLKGHSSKFDQVLNAHIQNAMSLA